MLERKTAYCTECSKNEKFTIKSERVELEIRGVRFSYVELSAYCSECGKEVYVPEINDKNVEAQENAYREAGKLITTDQIQKIFDKYDLGAKPLSKLMGYGEIMTYREKLQREHPEQLREDVEGGCVGCPDAYGYEPWKTDCLAGDCGPGDSMDERCRRCWDREMVEE